MAENIKRLAKILKANPNDSFTKFALALELLKKNEVTKSRVLFESILEQEPDYLGVYFHLGKLYEQIGSSEKAKNLYTAGIDLAEEQNNQRTKLELQDALVLLNSELNNE